MALALPWEQGTPGDHIDCIEPLYCIHQFQPQDQRNTAKQNLPSAAFQLLEKETVKAMDLEMAMVLD
jgi:hypothetical protein